MRAARYFRPGINGGLVVLLGLGLVSVGLSHARAIHEARRAREAVCAARVEAVLARNPLIRKGWFPSADACVNYASLTGEGR